MSYDISIVDRSTEEQMYAPRKHHVTGGTYCVGGTDELWLNITYNYWDKFEKAFSSHGSDGIHCIEGQLVRDTIPWIEEAISKLKRDRTDDYWESTEGNARAALENLLEIAKMGLDGKWRIT